MAHRHFTRSLLTALLLAGAGGAQASLNLFNDTILQPGETGLFAVYQTNRAHGTPNLITPDLLLASYGLIRQQKNTQVELQVLLPELTALTSGLSARTAKQHTPAGQLANHYLVLLQGLLTGALPANASDTLRAEWQQIEQAAGLATSSLWGTTVDYSQFKPRGRYTQNEQLRRYFIAYRYASTVNFFVFASKATGVDAAHAKQMTEVAVLLSRQIAADPELRKHYDTLQSTLNWEYGAGGDLNVADIEQALGKTAPVNPATPTKLLSYASEHLRLPSVIDLPVDTSKLEDHQTIAQVTLGWRLLPAAQTANGMAMQSILFPNTGEYNNPCGVIHCLTPWTASLIQGKEAKGYVSAYEIMSWQGSKEAQLHVYHQGDNLYEGYETATSVAQNHLQHAQGLEASQGEFMRSVFASPDTDRQQLTSMLGFWTWQQSINALYTKQVMTPASKSLSFSSPRKGAQLLGSPAFYTALTRLVNEQASHAPAAAAGEWKEFAAITQHLGEIAQTQNSPSQTDGKTENTAKALSAEDEVFLNELDTSLLSLTHGPDQPIVVDILTNPLDKLVVEEGIGLPRIEVKNGARGGWFSHFEFKQDMGARLTNEEWRQSLGATVRR